MPIASPDLSGRGNLIPHQVHRDCGACSEETRNLAPRDDERTVTNHVERVQSVDKYPQAGYHTILP